MPLREVQTLPYLLQRIAHALQGWHSDFRRLGLSVLAVRTLAVLSLNKQASVGELAEATFLDQPTVSNILRRLTSSGLVEKTRQDHDNRAVQVTLTAKGRKMAKLALDTATDHDRQLTYGLSDAQCHQVREVLETLYANIKSRERPREESESHLDLPTGVSAKGTDRP